MEKIEQFLFLVGVYGLVFVAGALVYNIFTGELDNDN